MSLGRIYKLSREIAIARRPLCRPTLNAYTLNSRTEHNAQVCMGLNKSVNIMTHSPQCIFTARHHSRVIYRPVPRLNTDSSSSRIWVNLAQCACAVRLDFRPHHSRPTLYRCDIATAGVAWPCLSVGRPVCRSLTIVSPAKTAEAIDNRHCRLTQLNSTSCNGRMCEHLFVRISMTLIYTFQILRSLIYHQFQSGRP